jgi:hypothetical protein
MTFMAQPFDQFLTTFMGQHGLSPPFRLLLDSIITANMEMTLPC